MIEPLWDKIKRNLAKRKPFPSTKEATIKALEEEWKAIPVEVVNSLVESMPKRVKRVLENNGGNNFHG